MDRVITELEQEEAKLLKRIKEIQEQISFRKSAKTITITKNERQVYEKFLVMDMVNCNGRLWWVKDGKMERVSSDELTPINSLINKNALIII